MTFGTPYWGAINAINYVANGYKEKLVDLTNLLRSFPSVYELMACYDVVKVGKNRGRWPTAQRGWGAGSRRTQVPQ